jgi:hypothetical protein
MSRQYVRLSVITIVPTTRTLGRPYITSFKADGSVSFWSFSGRELGPPAPNLIGTTSYTNEKHVRLLADTAGKVKVDNFGYLVPYTGDFFYDLVMFGDASVHIATRDRDEERTAEKFNDFAMVPVLEDFTYNAGWRVDKHIRYMVDITGTGRADVIGFGETSVFLSRNNGPDGFDLPSIVLNDLCYNQGWRLNKHLRFLANFSSKDRPDIIGFGETSVVLAKNNGDGTFDQQLHHLILDQFTYSSGWRVDQHVRIPADVTGNGLADIVGFDDSRSTTSRRMAP